MFDLKQPCKSCPFKRGNGEKFGLCRARLEEIFEAPAFQCHATVDYSYDEYGNTVAGQGNNPQQCLGLMSLLAQEGKPNQIMTVAERLNHCTVESRIHPDSYSTFEEALAAHEQE